MSLFPAVWQGVSICVTLMYNAKMNVTSFLMHTWEIISKWCIKAFLLAYSKLMVKKNEMASKIPYKCITIKCSCNPHNRGNSNNNNTRTIHIHTHTQKVQWVTPCVGQKMAANIVRSLYPCKGLATLVEKRAVHPGRETL